MKPLAFIILITAIIAGMFHVPAASAATLDVVANPSATIGQPFRVDIALDTQGDDANTIQGEIVFPSNLFVLKEINDGNSPVSLWIESPREISSGTIVFSGIIPGGFMGSASSVVGVILVPAASGTGVVGIQNVKLLRNDGKGSVIALATAGQTVTIGSSVAASSEEPLPSSTIPQEFIPTIAQDPNVYDGGYFLVFSTTDKGSGIDHYEVFEAPSGGSVQSSSPWHIATSPYLLTDQSLSSDIYVRAVDHDGNFIVMKVPARYPRGRWNLWELLGIIVFAIIIVLLLFIWMRRRRRHI